MRKLLGLLLFLTCFPVAQATLAADTGSIERLKQEASERRTDFQSWVQLGKAQAAQGRLDGAISSFRSAIFLRPELAGLHDQLAAVYIEKNDLQAVVRELESARQLEPARSDELHRRLSEDAYRRVMAAGNQPALLARLEQLLNARKAEAALHAAERPHAAETQLAGGKDQAIETIKPEQQVRDALEAWREAWSKRDLDAYFAAYADDFDPGKRFTSTDAWRKYKRRVIGRQAGIGVTIEGLELVPLSDGTFKAGFVQHYRSPTYSSDDNKSIWFKLTEGSWKIAREVSD